MKLKSTDAIALTTGRKRVVLISAQGITTAAGEYWKEIGGEVPPIGGFASQTPMREGNTETIRMMSGRTAVTRRFTTAGEYEFTKVGDKFYKKQMRNYVVQIPVSIRGLRKDGTTSYTVKSHLPIEKLGLTTATLPMSLSQLERDRRIKEMITDDLPLSGVIHEVSKETWTYDKTGSWLISEETVKYNAEEGETQDTVVLQRRMRGGPCAISRFLYPEALCKEAFEEHDDHLCCPRQIAAVLRLDLGEVIQQLGEVELALYQTSELEERGCTPLMLLEFAKKRQIGCVVLHNEAVIETLVGPTPLAFVVHENHCYLYSRPACARRSCAEGAAPAASSRRRSGPAPRRRWQTGCPGVGSSPPGIIAAGRRNWTKYARGFSPGSASPECSSRTASRPAGSPTAARRTRTAAVGSS